jgi:hypothetical protein
MSSNPHWLELIFYISLVYKNIQKKIILIDIFVNKLI